MSKKVIIIQHHYGATTAKTQRMLAASREFVNNGFEVVFIVSTDDLAFEEIKGVRFIKILETKRRFLQCCLHFIRAIKAEYGKDDILLFYDVPLYAFLFSRKKYNAFAEITEVPFYGKKMSPLQKIVFKIRLYEVKNFKGLFVISKALKKYYEGLGVKHIEVINMFVDPNRFNAIEKSEFEKYIAYCGRISYYKDGVNDLINAFSILTKYHPSFKLKIIGPFENLAVETQLRSLVAATSIVDKVEFTGLVSPTDLPAILKNASILALARPDNAQSKYGFPTKLGEYLATGNPVVVTRVGEIPNYITDMYNGILAEPGNPSNFAEKLKYVIEHPKEAAEIGCRGRELTMSEFSAKVQAAKALRFMQSTK